LAEEMSNSESSDEDPLSNFPGEDTSKRQEQYLLWRLGLWAR
jgi:hypothetical protein